MKLSFAAMLLALSAATAPLIASAQPSAAGGAGAAALARQDTNDDGLVTLQEALSAAARAFEHFDADRDGRVTLAERLARAPEWRRRRFEARLAVLDQDGDGALSREEARWQARRFARVDLDGDGRLRRGELWLAAGAGDTGALRGSFARRDLDRDGVVTRAEALSFAERRFQRRDRDGDGLLVRSPGGP